jgi:hypothetical protein
MSKSETTRQTKGKQTKKTSENLQPLVKQNASKQKTTSENLQSSFLRPAKIQQQLGCCGQDDCVFARSERDSYELGLQFKKKNANKKAHTEIKSFHRCPKLCSRIFPQDRGTKQADLRRNHRTVLFQKSICIFIVQNSQL